MGTVRVVLITACCLAASASIAAQSRAPWPVLAVSSADLDVWRAAVEQIRRDSQFRSSRLAILNQTIAFDSIREHLHKTQLKDALIQRLLEQNPVSVRLPPSLRLPPFRILDLDRFLDHYGRFEWERFDRFTSSERMWRVSVSRPGFSDDGMRAIVYTVTSPRRFEGLRGNGFIFEKFDGQWVLCERFATWIS